MEIDHGGLERVVAQVLLDQPQVDPGFEQVRRVAVPLMPLASDAMHVFCILVSFSFGSLAVPRETQGGEERRATGRPSSGRSAGAGGCSRGGIPAAIAGWRAGRGR